jgi:hypothetical protein
LHLKYKELWKNNLFNDNKNQIVVPVINSEHIDILKITLLLNHIYIGEIMTRDVLTTKFRISSHQLEIECGRYRKIPASQRICKLCNLEVEDVN